MESLSNDHSSAMRQAHRRQEELERANSELVRTLVEKDREVRRQFPSLPLPLPLCRSSGCSSRMSRALPSSRTSRRSPGTRSRSPSLSPPPLTTELQIESLTTSHSTLRSQLEAAKRKVSQSEIDLENQRKLWEQERTTLIERYSAGGGLESEQSSAHRTHEEERSQTIQQLESQVKSLGQQLLRKQDAMQELLSERAALKVRLQDYQRR
jgi:hypothetical protein